MRVTDKELPPDILSHIKGCAQDAARMLGISMPPEHHKHALKAIDSFLKEWQSGNQPPPPEGDDLCFTVGSLWGEQLADAFDWEWAGVTFHDQDNTNAVGILSADRSMVIYPFHFVQGCIYNNAPVTVLLSYNLLEGGSKVPTTPSGSYKNVMEYVHHIVPCSSRKVDPREDE